MSRSTRFALLTSSAVLAAATLAGCGGSDTGSTTGTGASSASSDASASSSPSGNATQDASALTITVKGDSVTPKNQRIDVALGTDLKVTVTSDRTGELHVHSSPEQKFDFKAGTSTTTFTFKTPGVVELEEHGSDTLIAQLEVR